MTRAALCLTLVGVFASAAYSDDSVPVVPTAPGFVPPGATYQPAPAGDEVPPPAPPLPDATLAPPAMIPQPAPAAVYSTGFPPHVPANSGLRGANYSFSSRAAAPAPADDGTTSYGPAPVIWAPGYWGGGVFGGAVVDGWHNRYPYYSYRAPWYYPGPAGMNATIAW
jgi:hypothetical protein